MEILLVGDRLTAQEAHRIGFVNEVLPSVRRADRHGRGIRREDRRRRPIAVRKPKETVLRTVTATYEEAWLIENETAAQTMRTDDAREGPRAFMEKRHSNFQGH